MLVTIANSAQFGNDARIAPGARVDDGRARSGGDGGALALAHGVPAAAAVQRHGRTRAPGCSIRRIREATIDCDQPMMFHVDGEPVQGGTTLRARIHPGALMIAVR